MPRSVEPDTAALKNPLFICLCVDHNTNTHNNNNDDDDDSSNKSHAKSSVIMTVMISLTTVGIMTIHTTIITLVTRMTTITTKCMHARQAGRSSYIYLHVQRFWAMAAAIQEKLWSRMGMT